MAGSLPRVTHSLGSGNALSGWARALLGAALGALAVLLSHPASRSFYAPTLWGWSAVDGVSRSPYLPQNIDDPPPPDTFLDGAYWLMLGADRRQRQIEVTTEDRAKLIAIALAGSKADPTNAFWDQMASAWVFESGDEGEARRLWRQAAKRPQWNDYQTDRLRKAEEAIAPGEARTMAWVYAYLYNARSPAPAKLVQRQAGRFFDRSGLESPDDLRLRVDILRNGALLRDNGRLVQSSLIGTQIVSTAPLAERPGGLPEVRESLLEREAFLRRLSAQGLYLEAQHSESAFADNDAWSALVDRQASTREFRVLAWAALAAATLPGALAALALAGFGLAGLGWLLERARWLNWIFAMPGCAITGVPTAIAVYGWTDSLTASMFTALCFGFFAFVPTARRTAEPNDLGPFYRYSLLLLGGLSGTSLLLWFVGWAPPARRLIPLLELPRELAPGNPALLGLTFVFLGLALATAPAWALLHRFEARRLAGRIVFQIGRGVGITALALAVLAGPLAISADRYAGQRLERLMENEPLVYIMRR